MLRILKFWLITFLFFGISYAGNQFFNGPVNFFGTYKTNKGCHGCKEILNIHIHKHTKNKKGTENKIKLLVFIAPGEGLSFDAVRRATIFRNSHPNIEIRGIIIAKLQGWVNTLLSRKYLFDRTFPFYYEPGLNTAIEFHVTRIPAFVFVYKNKIVKVSGQPDLEKVYRKIKNK